MTKKKKEIFNFWGIFWFFCFMISILFSFFGNEKTTDVIPYCQYDSIESDFYELKICEFQLQSLTKAIYMNDSYWIQEMLGPSGEFRLDLMDVIEENTNLYSQIEICEDELRILDFNYDSLNRDYSTIVESLDVNNNNIIAFEYNGKNLRCVEN